MFRVGRQEGIGEEQTSGSINTSINEAKQRYEQGNITMLNVVDSDSYNELFYKIKEPCELNQKTHVKNIHACQTYYDTAIQR